MKKVIKALAKINLFLKINRKKNDGYHDLTMVMQTVSLHDTMEIEITKYGEFDLFGFIKFPERIMTPIPGFANIDLKYLKQFARRKEDLDEEKQVNLKCNFSFIPTDDRNLIVKVVKYIFEKYEIKDKIFIFLKKMIPTGAGLGGGSSDAAEILLFLNDFYKLNLSKNDMVDIVLQFGSDIPFFIYKKTCICEGRGELITEIPAFNSYFVLLATPNIRVSTKDVYENYDNVIKNCKNINSKEINDNYENLISGIKNKNISEITKNISNDLEIATKNIEEIDALKGQMIENGALCSLMSGSGPTVYGIFTNYFNAQKCKEKLKKKYKNAFVFISKPV